MIIKNLKNSCDTQMLELNFDFAVQPYTKFNLRMEIEKLRISGNLVLKYASYLRIFFRFT